QQRGPPSTAQSADALQAYVARTTQSTSGRCRRGRSSPRASAHHRRRVAARPSSIEFYASLSTPGDRSAPAVTQPVHRLQRVELRVRRGELLAQALDVSVDGAVADVSVFGVTLGDELLARLHSAGMPRQRVEDAELG